MLISKYLIYIVYGFALYCLCGNAIAFICYRNNTVEIDTGTEVCTEIDENDIVDIETGTVTQTGDDNEEFKDLYEHNI